LVPLRTTHSLPIAPPQSTQNELNAECAGREVEEKESYAGDPHHSRALLAGQEPAARLAAAPA
jgi:hypothetical protein